MTIPQLNDWTADLNERIATQLQSKEGIATVLAMCDDALAEMQPAYDFASQQKDSLQTLRQNYSQLYLARFGELYASKSIEIVLDTTESRREAVRGAALEVVDKYGLVTDQDVLDYLKREGKVLAGGNPKAIVSTILWGFKSQFEKVADMQGVFQYKGLPKGVL